ncbi:MAG TPA: acyl carrier protein [Terrimesophilobacter sp.]|nr:acyl carrier protein [Terrimesophilobacter sp.]
MNEKDFIALLEEIVEVAPDTIALNDSLDSYDWDSLSLLGFISAIDSRLGVALDAEKLSNATTPADLLNIVNDASST